ncbi:MAG: universal stress protein [Rubrobacteraceae bacterium]
MSIFPTKILSAVDASEDSILALRSAVDLANNNDSELHVLHVGLASFWTTPDAMHPEEAERLEESSRQTLDEQVEKVEGASEAVAEKHLKMGEKVDEQIVNLADEIGAGLILVGSRGKNTMERLLLGSVAESVVRHAHCPVLVVRQ